MGTRATAGRGRLVLLGASLLLAGCSGGREPRQQQVASSLHAQIAPTTDVPALLGASIDGLRQRLGASMPLPPHVAAGLPEATLNLADSVTTFRTGGLLLVASYDVRSRRVRDLLLLGHREDSLMGRASLRANVPEYLVMPIFHASNSFKLVGLRVIATN